MKSLFKLLIFINLKTIYFNFKYLSFKDALKLPFFISRKTYFSRLNGSVKINSPIKPGLIRIGFGNVGVFDKKVSRTMLEIDGVLEFNGMCNIGHGSKISVGKSGEIIFGDNFKISAESTVISYRRVKFGSNCLLSWDVLIMDTDFHSIHNSDDEIINEDREIVIADNVWIGCRTIILKGSIIPNGVIIGAGSIVNNKLYQNKALYAGIPVIKLKDNIKWKP